MANEVGWQRKLDNTKWCLTLLIVLYHIQLPSTADGLAACIFMYIKNMGDCVVPAFALISGYLFFYNVDCFSSVKDKMKRRVWTLLIPYLAWNFLNSLYIIWLNNGIRGFLEGVLAFDWLRNLIMWDASPHFWYIYMLMFWTVLAPVLYTIFKDKRLIWILLLSQAIYLFCKGPNILHSRFIYMLYTWGGVIGFYCPKLAEKFAGISGTKNKVVVFGSGIMYFMIGFVYMNWSSMSILVWCYAIRAIILIVFLVNIPILPIGSRTNYLYAFWLFAIHYYLDGFVGGIAQLYLPTLISQSFSWLVVCCIGLGMGWIVYRFMPRTFGVLTGRRRVCASDIKLEEKRIPGKM